MPRALLIDDEISARRDLRALLGAHPEVTIVGEAALIDEALALLRRDEYDLVFLDIQLIGGTGFDLVPDVRPAARIIFVTAFDRFALRAFEVNALDYLRKPLRVARLAEALRRLPPGADSASRSQLSALGSQLSALSSPLPSLLPDDLLSVKNGPGTTRFVRLADLVLLPSQDNYTEVRLALLRYFPVGICSNRNVTYWVTFPLKICAEIEQEVTK